MTIVIGISSGVAFKNSLEAIAQPMVGILNDLLLLDAAMIVLVDISQEAGA